MDIPKPARYLLLFGISTMILGLCGIVLAAILGLQQMKFSESAGIGAVGGAFLGFAVLGTAVLLIGLALSAVAGLMYYKNKNGMK
jgi:hypothetical protein